jgi:hypothetical protein
MFFGTARFRGAYLDTDYIVRSNEDVVVIRIGLESPMVDRSLSRFNARSAVFITASDPLSSRQGNIVNQSAHRDLKSDSSRLKTSFLGVKDEVLTATGHRRAAFSHSVSQEVLRLHYDAASDGTLSYSSDTETNCSC